MAIVDPLVSKVVIEGHPIFVNYHYRFVCAGTGKNLFDQLFEKPPSESDAGSKDDSLHLLSRDSIFRVLDSFGEFFNDIVLFEKGMEFFQIYLDSRID